jgi:predicted metal-dependent phosphoesterase TrpH
VLALTDHDTTHGWAEAAVAAKNEGIGFVPGIEVSTRVHLPENSFGMHMLAYLPDPNHPALKFALEEVVIGREKRLQAIVELVAADYDINWQDVLDELEDGATAGRPAVADALIKKGHFTHRDEVFEKIWESSRKYSMPNREVPDTMDAIDLIRAAGGVPIIAHPLARGKRPPKEFGFPIKHYEAMIERGLAGFEAWHRDVEEDSRDWLIELAKKHDLIITGSSDYHGILGKPNRLGENTTSEEMLQRILEQGTGTKALL